MIRAFAVGVAVGTIRIWQAIFVGFGLLSFEDAFGPTFWISFSLHVAAAELWLRARPNPPELAQPATPALAVPHEAAT
jgi:predicted membrane metal-binding protein